MRTVEVKLGDTTYELVASFKSSMDLSEKVGDPLMIFREAMVEAMMMEAGIEYTPKWRYTIKNIPIILHTGMKESGKTLEDVQNLVFEVGFIQAQQAAFDYISAIVGPAPESAVDSSSPDAEK